MRAMFAWIAGLLFVAVPAITEAHVTATGLARITVDGDAIVYRLSLALPELPDPAALLLLAAVNGDQASAEDVATRLRAAVVVELAGAACRPGRIRIQGSGANEARAQLEMHLACGRTRGRLDIREDWRDFLGEHYQTLASIQTGNGRREFVLGENAPAISIDLERPLATGWQDFIGLGIEHILTGYDHLLFLLVLLARTSAFWPIVRIVTSFSVAHSVTLSLAGLGILVVPPGTVEPLIAASITWVALENLLPRDPTRWRWRASFLFGLMHGMGFAAALGPLDLVGGALVRALVGFILGVELGQLAFIVLALPVLTWLAIRRGLTLLPRVLSVAIAAVGAYWFFERVFVA